MMVSISTLIESMTAVGVRDGDMCVENDAPPVHVGCCWFVGCGGPPARECMSYFVVSLESRYD